MSGRSPSSAVPRRAVKRSLAGWFSFAWALTASAVASDLLRMGLTIAQVVRGYGDVCQTIIELLVEQRFATRK